MRLRLADCGHLIPEDFPPIGTMQNGPYEREVYACKACEAALRAMFESERPQPKDRVETKEVESESKQVSFAISKRVYPTKMSNEVAADLGMTEDLAMKGDPYWQGRTARAAGVSQADNPYDGRSKQGRNWQRGWYEGESSKK